MRGEIQQKYNQNTDYLTAKIPLQSKIHLSIIPEGDISARMCSVPNGDEGEGVLMFRLDGDLGGFSNTRMR